MVFKDIIILFVYFNIKTFEVHLNKTEISLKINFGQNIYSKHLIIL